ncbi:MAG: hypothetical protein JWM10_4230 [Myxococcaceae bacterium]|nr:hypothetical protein [Myxococcaceae bacterium]
MTTKTTGDDLPKSLGKPALRALRAAGITTLAQATARPPAELLKLHGVGPKALNALAAASPSRE